MNNRFKNILLFTMIFFNLCHSCDNEKNEALMNAVRRGRIEDVQRLLEDPAVDKDYQNINGNTALAVAAIKGDVNICKLLLTYQVNVNLINRYGRTALAEAIIWVLKNNDPIIKLLLDKTENFDLIPEEHFDIINRAACKGSIHIIKLLDLISLSPSQIQNVLSQELQNHCKDILNLYLNYLDYKEKYLSLFTNKLNDELKIHDITKISVGYCALKFSEYLKILFSKNKGIIF